MPEVEERSGGWRGAARPPTKGQELSKYFTEQDLEDTKCGLQPCGAGRLSVLATKESLVVMYSLIFIVRGMNFSYTVAVLSTLEKRFSLTSKQTGIMVAGNDIAAVFLAIFIGYVANMGHRPRWMGWSLLLTALSCFLSAFPHLLYGSGEEATELLSLSGYNHDSSSSGVNSTSAAPGHLAALTSASKAELCDVGSRKNNSVCGGAEDSGSGESYISVIVIIFVAQLILGVSDSILFSISLSYMDDNLSKKTTSFYYSIFLLLRVMGPVLGFLLGGKCLSLWITPSARPPVPQEDLRWLGAWWLGFLIIGGLLVVLGVVMLQFPRKLPATLRRETRRRLRLQGEEGLSATTENTNTRDKPTLKKLLSHLGRVFRSKVWSANLFNSVTAILATFGYTVFKPKYIEHQFQKTASDANYYTGVATMVATSVGVMVSAGVLRWVRPSARWVTGYNVLVTLLTCCCYLILMFVGCEEKVIMGMTNQTEGCGQVCGCSTEFSPVCSADQVTVFLSPCYAGCSSAHKEGEQTIYNECRCIVNTTVLHQSASDSSLAYQSELSQSFHAQPQSNQPATSQSAVLQAVLQAEGQGGTATSGYCPETCPAFLWYLAVQVAMETFLSSSKAASTMIFLRSVADEDKGLALGIFEVMIALFGFLPAPVIMGAIIDWACEVWQETCGESGSCLRYNGQLLRLVTHVVPAGIMLVSVIGDIIVYCNHDLLDLYGDKEDQVKADKSQELLSNQSEAVDGQNNGSANQETTKALPTNQERSTTS